MSVIKLKCVAQAISILNSPIISSGNVNFDSVEFEFCDTWSGYSKTAIFYRKRDEAYYQLLVDDKCTIPKEVLASKGIFYIGVFGSKDDVVITSEVVAYRVNEGAITEELLPPDPTPDIYSQILAQFSDVEVMYNEIKDSVDMIGSHEERVTTLENAIVKTTDTTLAGSKLGGLRLTKVVGNTEQKTYAGNQLFDKSLISHATITETGFKFTNIDQEGSGFSIGKLRDVVPSVKVGDRLVWYADVTNASIGEGHLYCETDWDKGLFITVTETMLDRLVNVYGKLNMVCEYSNMIITKHENAPYEPYCGGIPSPNPNYPQSMYHTSDVVEMIQGYYNRSTGLYTSSTYHVCSKNKIPCKSGDVVKVNFDVKATISIVYFANGVFNSYSTGTDVTEHSATIPSGTTHFTIHASKSDGTEFPIDTVGKITLTINGKYVGCVRAHGKNFAKGFKAHANITAQLTDEINVKPNTDYVASIQNSGLGGQLFIVIGGTNTSIKSKTFNDSIELPFNSGNNECIHLQINVTNGDNTVTVPILSKCTQLELGTVATPFEEYRETVAHFLTNEPPRLGDVVFKDTDGLWKVERNVSTMNIDSTSQIVKEKSNNTNSYVYYTTNVYKKHGDLMCDKLPFKSYNDMSNGNDISTIGVTVSPLYPTVIYFNVGYFLTENTVANVKEFLASNPIEIQYPLATPTIEILDTESQIALNSLETFDSVTYVEVDSRVKPLEIESEYGITQTGAYTLKSLLNSETNAVKIDQAISAMLALSQS